MTEQVISVIGCGNMARSLIGGLIADGRNPQSIWVSDLEPDRADHLRQHLAVNVAQNNTEAVEHAEVVILAVKPQVIKAVAEEITHSVQQRQPLIISVAAGIREQDLSRWLGGTAAVVRAMPNTPALIQAGATALYANSRVSSAQHNIAETIMRAVGLVLWLNNEDDMDSVTALSGCGPAYYFLIMEAMQAAAEQLGLTPETARLLTLQTAFGAAKMALESPEQPATLRANVTSPGGATEQALRVLEDHDIRRIFAEALKAATERAQQLATNFGEQ